MKLQEKYKQGIPESYAIEFPKESGVFHIPIYRIIEMMGEDFEKYSTTNFHFEYLQRGQDCILSGSLSLTIIDSDCGEHTFIGGANFNLKRYAENEHFIATLKSECIKNAVKHIGDKYGMSLNQGMLDIQTLKQIENGDFTPQKSPKKSPIKKGIGDILRKQEERN